MSTNNLNSLNELLSLILRISNKDYQFRIWVKGIGPECEFFDDVVCDFFDDCDPLLENYKEYGLTDKQYQILKDFRDKFEVFADENSWPPFFIDTPEWAQIMEEAKKVLKVFNYEKPSEKEGV